MAHSYPSASETEDGFKKLSSRYAITIIEQQEEISRLKRENNNLRQKLHRGKSEDPGITVEETQTRCWCEACRPLTMSDMRFIVCPKCGNKRCPKATDHRNKCTGSNELNQIAEPEEPGGE